MTSTPLSSADKGHYLPPLQVLPSLWRPFHSGSTYARDLSKTKVTIYLTWESYMCRKPDSLVSFYLIYFYIYGVIFILFWFVSQRRDNTSRFNLLFGLIGHFGLLKDVNISFFLSGINVVNKQKGMYVFLFNEKRKGDQLFLSYFQTLR
mgnify:CR=1 FL=1